MLRFRIVAFVFTLGLAAAQAEIKLPAIISDHMVLQTGDLPAPIWGWAEPGEEITVSLAGATKTSKAGVDGKWIVKLENLKPSGTPQTLTVKGRNTLTVHDVLAGEVWLCSGQSNMEMQVKGLHGQVDRADEEIAAANYPQIRMFAYDEVYNIYKLPVPPQEPAPDRVGKWSVCSPETVAQFSALGYFFGRELHRQLGVPVGLINSSVGGTPIEAWTSLQAQQKVAALQPVLDSWRQTLAEYDPEREQQKAAAIHQTWLKQRKEAVAQGQPVPKARGIFKNLRVSSPGGLFNGMIAPLVPYAFRGVIWYQGERNAAGPLTKYYGLQLQTLIHDWRTHWGTEFYFAWVQLPWAQKKQQAPSEPNGWGVMVRDGMRKALSVPRTGMAITMDYGNATQAHLPNKADFARRLSLPVLHDVYGKAIPIWSGPLFRSVRRDGNKMVVAFDHAENLKPSAGELEGFAIAGKDQKFVWASARIEKNQAIVWNDAVQEPVAVRYSWASNPKGNLVNAAGLPASPFRTDDWE